MKQRQLLVYKQVSQHGLFQNTAILAKMYFTPPLLFFPYQIHYPKRKGWILWSLGLQYVFNFINFLQYAFQVQRKPSLMGKRTGSCAVRKKVSLLIYWVKCVAGVSGYSLNLFQFSFTHLYQQRNFSIYSSVAITYTAEIMWSG